MAHSGKDVLRYVLIHTLCMSAMCKCFCIINMPECTYMHIYLCTHFHAVNTYDDAKDDDDGTTTLRVDSE